MRFSGGTGLQAPALAAGEDRGGPGSLCQSALRPRGVRRERGILRSFSFEPPLLFSRDRVDQWEQTGIHDLGSLPP
jgi:hypothetical protein